MQEVNDDNSYDIIFLTKCTNYANIGKKNNIFIIMSFMDKHKSVIVVSHF